MAFPAFVAPVALGLGAGLGLKWIYDKYVLGSDKEVSSYVRGKTYTLRVTTAFTPDQMVGLSAAGTGDIVEGAAVVLKTTFQQQGFDVLSKPALRDQHNIDLFRTGNPAEWILNARWTRDDKSRLVIAPPIVSVKGTLQPSL
jgi:hypothetical protein